MQLKDCKRGDRVRHPWGLGTVIKPAGTNERCPFLGVAWCEDSAVISFDNNVNPSWAWDCNNEYCRGFSDNEEVELISSRNHRIPKKYTTN